MSEQMRIRRHSKRLWVLIPVVFAVMFGFGFVVQKIKSGNEAEAASLAGFDPGYIISDWQMGNYNSMSESDIQNFLRSKNSCGNTDYGYYLALSSNPNYRWHFENGHFICLSEERFGYNDNEIGFQYGETAAHIIWQAAQDYRINPQVLLVLLQKETGLITDPIPNNGDYRKATGYGCPDTAACSSQYYGFRNQIRNAAALFRTVLDGGWTNYPLGNNYIQYNPNGACGGSVVNVRSLATSALYRYTPYQPNGAALGAGYGYGDGCSAYGNRNFYLYFEDWFGDSANEGWPNKEDIIRELDGVGIASSDLELEYDTHVQHYGWIGWRAGGSASGSVGHKARLEAVSLKLRGQKTGIEYRTHVQTYGWGDYKKDGEVSGTIGESLRVEAIQIRLSGDLGKLYDVYYRTHVQGIGWMDWVMNDEVSGTTGQARRVEALQIRIVRKYSSSGVSYSSHVQSLGWADWVKDGVTSGTTGQAKRMEAIEIKLADGTSKGGSIRYRTHVQTFGWTDWVENGKMSGTTGQAKRMEAIEIEMSGEMVDLYDVYYRTHVQSLGWTDWVKNGATSGTTGQARRLEAIEIELIEK